MRGRQSDRPRAALRSQLGIELSEKSQLMLMVLLLLLLLLMIEEMHRAVGVEFKFAASVQQLSMLLLTLVQEMSN